MTLLPSWSRQLSFDFAYQYMSVFFILFQYYITTYLYTDLRSFLYASNLFLILIMHYSCRSTVDSSLPVRLWKLLATSRPVHQILISCFVLGMSTEEERISKLLNSELETSLFKDNCDHGVYVEGALLAEINKKRTAPSSRSKLTQTLTCNCCLKMILSLLPFHLRRKIISRLLLVSSTGHPKSLNDSSSLAKPSIWPLF